MLWIWDTKTVLEDFKNTNVIAVLKKGDRLVYNNYRGISLQCFAGKILARILVDVAEKLLVESQFGFRCSHGTTGTMFCARQFQAKSSRTVETTFGTTAIPPTRYPDQRFYLYPIAFVAPIHDVMIGRICSQNSLSVPSLEAWNKKLRTGSCPVLLAVMRSVTLLLGLSTGRRTL